MWAHQVRRGWPSVEQEELSAASGRDQLVERAAELCSAPRPLSAASTYLSHRRGYGWHTASVRMSPHIDAIVRPMGRSCHGGQGCTRRSCLGGVPFHSVAQEFHPPRRREHVPWSARGQGCAYNNVRKEHALCPLVESCSRREGPRTRRPRRHHVSRQKWAFSRLLAPKGIK